MLLAVVAVALVVTAPADSANPQIAGLQVALRAYGFYLGPIDGVSGQQQTATAVRAFQRSNRLAVDGVPGATTRRALGRLGKPLYGKRTLVQGRVGWDVSVLQYLLARHGVGRVIDGYYGAETVLAVRRFQRRANLVVDGIAGPATLRALGGTSASTRLPDARYVVREGDSLTAIAEKHGTTLRSLASTNRIRSGATAPDRDATADPSRRVGATGRSAVVRARDDHRNGLAVRRRPFACASRRVDGVGFPAACRLLRRRARRNAGDAADLGLRRDRSARRERAEDDGGQHPDRRRLPPAPPPRVQGRRAARSRRLLPGRQGSVAEHGLYAETRTYVEAIRSLRGRV